MGLLMTAMAGLPYRHRWNMDVISGGRVRPVPWPGAPSPILGSARIGDQTAAGPWQRPWRLHPGPAARDAS